MAIETKIAFRDGSPSILEMWGTGGPTILCLHGMTSCRDAWARLGERLAGRAMVFAYDERGHGDAPYSGGPTTLQQMTEDLADVLAITGPIDLLIGASLGGPIAMAAGREHPIPAIVAVDPFFLSVRGDWGAKQLAGARSAQRLPKPERDEAMRRKHTGADGRDLASRIRAIDGLSIPWLETFMRQNRIDEGGWDHTAQLADYPKPLHVMIAGVESIIPSSHRDRIAEIGGANVRVKHFPGHPHALHRTAFDEFTADVEEIVAAKAR